MCRVKKEDEFNRPRIPVADRVIKRSRLFVSKKVNIEVDEGIILLILKTN
jgi:hypothetical protein